MRKTVSLLLVAGLIAAMAVAPASAGKKKKPRVQKGTYSCPCGVQVLGVGPGFRLGSGEGGIQILSLPNEKFVSLELTDDSGQPVYFQLSQNLEGGDNLYETDIGDGCGKTEEPLPIPQPGSDIVAFLYSGTCGTSGVAVATGGAFVATLSAKP